MAVKWEKTRSTGVRYYKHDTRKHGVKFDVYYAIRYQVDGGTKEEGLGWASDGWSESKARDVRAELVANNRSGEGPRTLKDKRRQQSLVSDAAPTFGRVAEEFLVAKAKPSGLRPKTLYEYGRDLPHVLDWAPTKETGPLKEWKFGDVKRRHLAKRLNELADRSQSHAKNIRAAVSSLYSWAKEEPHCYAEINLVTEIKAPKAPEPRERCLNNAEIGKLWCKLQTAEGEPEMIRCVKFALITGVRISDARRMTAAEVEGDWWVIPRERFKGKRSNLVYLTDTAKALIGDGGPVVFPSIKKGKGKPFDVSSFAHWLADREYFGLKRFTCHDFRRTITTGLQRKKVTLADASVTIGHKPQGVTSRHYSLYEYEDEIQAALIKWEAHVLECAGEALKELRQ